MTSLHNRNFLPEIRIRTRHAYSLCGRRRGRSDRVSRQKPDALILVADHHTLFASFWPLSGTRLRWQFGTARTVIITSLITNVTSMPGLKQSGLDRK